MAAGPIENSWRWRADARHFHCVDMGEVTYVFNRRSGETHMLNPVSISLLDLLVEQPLSLDDMMVRLPDHLGVMPEECPPSLTLKLFAELDDVGLVDRVIAGGACDGAD